MTTSDNEQSVIRELLWNTLDGGHYDLASLKEQMRNDAHFVKDLHLDSLDLLEFVLRIEERFKIQIEEEDYAKLTSVQAVAEFLKQQNATLET